MKLVAALLCSTVLLIAGASLAEPPSDNDPFAVRVEGYLGAVVADVDNYGDESAFEGGGMGSAVALFGPAFFQLDVYGDYMDFDEDLSTVGLGGYLGLVGAEVGSVALTGGWERALGSTDVDLGRVGAEGELYLGAFTLGAAADYLRIADTHADGWDAYGLVRFYPTENLKLEGVGGYADLGPDGVPQGGLLVEYRPEGFWLSFFARWVGRFDIGDSGDLHSAVAGVRFYWDRGLSLRETDRVYFR